MNAATNNTAVRAAIPAGVQVYAQGDVLYVHAGNRMEVVGKIGALAKVQAAAGFSDVMALAPARDTRWAKDTAAVAAYTARAINAYPTLLAENAAMRAKVAALEARLKAKGVAA